ncbi:hypothetical protein RN001_009694 [Aquatica leii]|uniref:Uncharacterized protein n=1 Tax=Aquatica leii TaxID=1421715 RepID=A0AAN7QGP8_9COLE|nr:hypothetical protein RN001_009694 [Aquatica leii]
MDQFNFKFICTLQIWDKILESVDKMNVALQSKTMTIDKASELIKGLTSQIQNICETVDIVFEKAKTICEQCHIEDNFLEKRRKRVKRHDLSESSDTGYDITQQQSFKIQINEAIDTIISELKWRFEKLRDIQNSFGFLTLKHITTYSVEELKKHAADLSMKYSADINATEFWSEIETLKSQVEATTLFDKCECQSSMGLLKAVVELDLKEMFPNKKCFTYICYIFTIHFKTSINSKLNKFIELYKGEKHSIIFLNKKAFYQIINALQY